MQLIDFLQSTGFNRLRTQMGAQDLGHFELFDASCQLTLSERESLAQSGLAISAQDLKVLKDKTLAFKNSRVWLKSPSHYHLAYCQDAQELRHHSSILDVGTAVLPAQKDGGVCLACLALLQYQGVDSRRLRRPEYCDQVGKDFSLQEFGRHYPFYPVS
ncbi:MAG: hypothetical protein RL217_1762 [Pseudomonadota bacterium]|jgi:hypothetical protein